MKSAQQDRPRYWAGGFTFVGALLALTSFGACGQQVEVGIDDALSTAGTAGGGMSSGGSLQVGGVENGGTGTTGGAPGCTVTACRGKVYQCGDCKDNADADGLIDALDPDCFGPCDDDETGLSTGLTSIQAVLCKQDCYFDGNAGPGNDKCEWNHSCDPKSVAPNYPPSGEARCKYNPTGVNMGVDCTLLATTQEPSCLDTCLPLVPNGCDCFGCCELVRGSGEFHYIGAGPADQGCQRDNLDDPIKCPPCTQVGSCLNKCETCETCVGGVATDPSCEPGAACPVGRKACGPDVPCRDGDYCVTGCCVPPPK